MGKLTDDMTRLVDEIHTMDESRCNFIKGVQNAVKKRLMRQGSLLRRSETNLSVGSQDVVKQKADETRQFLKEFRNDMDGATKPSSARRVLLEETTPRKKQFKKCNRDAI